MSVAVTRIVIEANTEQYDQQTQAAQNRAAIVANQQVALINQTSEITLLTLQAFGVAIDQQHRVLAHTLRTSINTFIQTRAALAISNPLLAAQTVAVGGAELFFLYKQLQAIEQNRADSAAQMAAAYSLFRQVGGVRL